MIIIDPQCTASTVAVLKLRKGKTTKVITGPALGKKMPKVRELTRELEEGQAVCIIADRAFKLVKRGYVASETKAGKVTVKKPPASALLVQRVHPNTLTDKDRIKMAGPGIKGEALRAFVEDGLTLDEQQERARQHTALAEADWRSASRAKKRERKRKRTPSGIDDEVITDARARKRERKQRTKREPLPEGMLTPKEIAEQAELTGGEIRKFLRAKNIGKRDGRYAFKPEEAAKIVKAARRHYS